MRRRNDCASSTLDTSPAASAADNFVMESSYIRPAPKQPHAAERVAAAPLFNDLGNPIKTRLDFRGDRLKEHMLIGLRDLILAQSQCDFLPMRHRLDAGNIHGLHLLDHVKYSAKLRERRLGFGVIDRDAREACDTFHVVKSERHKITGCRA